MALIKWLRHVIVVSHLHPDCFRMASVISLAFIFYKGSLLVTYTQQWNVFSAFNPSLRSIGQPQHSARGATPDSMPVPWSRILTGDRPNVHVLTVGETRAPRKNPRRYGLPQPGIKPRTFLLWDSASLQSLIQSKAVKTKDELLCYLLCVCEGDCHCGWPSYLQLCSLQGCSAGRQHQEGRPAAAETSSPCWLWLSSDYSQTGPLRTGRTGCRDRTRPPAQSPTSGHKRFGHHSFVIQTVSTLENKTHR